MYYSVLSKLSSAPLVLISLTHDSCTSDVKFVVPPVKMYVVVVCSIYSI